MRFYTKFGWTVRARLRPGAAPFAYARAQGFPWFVSDWGALTVNPMAREGYEVKGGEVLDFGVRFVVHDGDVGEARVAGMWGYSWGEIGVVGFALQ